MIFQISRRSRYCTDISELKIEHDEHWWLQISNKLSILLGWRIRFTRYFDRYLNFCYQNSRSSILSMFLFAQSFRTYVSSINEKISSVEMEIEFLREGFECSRHDTRWRQIEERSFALVTGCSLTFFFAAWLHINAFFVFLISLNDDCLHDEFDIFFLSFLV